MKIYMLLADAAQEVNGKFYILGGGWEATATPIPSMAVVIKVMVPWTSTNKKLEWKLSLVNEDGNSVRDEAGNVVGAAGHVEVGRPPGLPQGAPVSWSQAFNINHLPLALGRYEWQFSIDESIESVPFVVRQ